MTRHSGYNADLFCLNEVRINQPIEKCTYDYLSYLQLIFREVDRSIRRFMRFCSGLHDHLRVLCWIRWIRNFWIRGWGFIWRVGRCRFPRGFFGCFHLVGYPSWWYLRSWHWRSCLSTFQNSYDIYQEIFIKKHEERRIIEFRRRLVNKPWSQNLDQFNQSLMPEDKAYCKSNKVFSSTL